MRRRNELWPNCEEVSSSLTFKGFHRITDVDFHILVSSMARRIASVLVLSTLLAGCGGNPFLEEPEEEEPAVNPVPPLPGTGTPSPNRSIARYEARETGSGNGYAENITYDGATDTFSVDNLGFDGANLYERGAAVGAMGPYQVYEATEVVNDPLTGRPIPQFQHRLLAGMSASGQTSFAIVRTGAYVGYGFGGFVLAREGGVVLPTSGQAGYSGAYAGLQDFDGAGGLRYTSGDAFVAIDFEDFNDGDAVQGRIDNRRIFDINGNDITAAVIGQINTEYNPSAVAGGDIVDLPTIVFRVGPGVIDANGEIRGFLDSTLIDYGAGSGPAVVPYETGNYYAIVSGANAEEVVGIIVVESPYPGIDGITVRETGGFVLYR